MGRILAALALLISLIAVAAVVTVGPGSLLARSPSSTDSTPTPLPLYPDSTPDEPLFDGELLGIYFGPDPARRGYNVNAKELCPEGPVRSTDSKLIPDVPPYLPDGAAQSPTYRALVTEPNPGASSCSSQEQAFDVAWRYFEIPKADGPVANILLNRVRLHRPFREVTVGVSRIGIESVGGKKMVIVKPFRFEPVDIGTWVQVVIPEEGGYLAIQSQGVAFDEVIRIAESIATGVAPQTSVPQSAPTLAEIAPPPSPVATGPEPTPPPPVENRTPRFRGQGQAATSCT